MSALNDHRASECLDAEALLELASKGQKATEYDFKMDHIAICPICSETLFALKAANRIDPARTAPATSRIGRVRWGWLIAVPTAAAATLAIWTLLGRDDPGGQAPVIAKNPPKVTTGGGPVVKNIEPPPKNDLPKNPVDKPEPIVKVQPTGDGGRKQIPPKPSGRTLYAANIEKRTDGWYEGGARIEEQYAVYAGMIAKEPEIVRSGSDANGPDIVLITPDYGNRALIEQPMTFRWKPVTNAVGYEARIKSPSSAEETILKVEGTTAHLGGMNLQPGSSHLLSITAELDPAKSRPSEVTKEATYTFHVLSTREAADAQWARKNLVRTPFTGAMILYKLGLLKEAAAVPLKVAGNGSDAKWARRMRAELRQRLADPSR